MILWTPYNWLNKFYKCYMAAVVGIISRYGLRIEACLTNQPNKSKLPLPITVTLAAVYHSCTYCVQDKALQLQR